MTVDVNVPSFGNQPFSVLQRVEVHVKESLSAEKAAFLQYQLLLQPAVVRCHVGAVSSNVTLLVNPTLADHNTILGWFPPLLHAQITDSTLIRFEKLLKNTFHM